MMRYFSDQIWARLPLADFRPRFFIETYIEKLSINTPHFYQARLMNVLSSCAETLACIEEYKTNSKNAGYVLNALDEVDCCWQADAVARRIFSQFQDAKDSAFKKIRAGDWSDLQLRNVSVICRAIVSEESLYNSSLTESLRTSLTERTDLKRVERITQEIYQLTDLFVTNLLNRGYSPTYLFNRSDSFTREASYSGRSFAEQFDLIVEKLNNKSAAFEVYYVLEVGRQSLLPKLQSYLDFEFFNEIPDFIHGTHREKLSKDIRVDLVAKASIDATDYVTAAWQVKDRLDRVLDAVTALELNPKIKTSSNCVVVQRHQQLTHIKTLGIDLLISFLTSEGGTHLGTSEGSIHQTLEVLNPAGKEQLGRSLRYLRLARESVSPESKFLNLWIALESIFSDTEEAKLSAILEYVPQIYALSSIRRRVGFLGRLLAVNQIAMTPGVQRALGGQVGSFSASTSERDVYVILQNSKVAEELFDSLGSKEHLKFKLFSSVKELSDCKTIWGRLKKSESDVVRQLRRIYFLRNKIAHTGHYKNIRPQIITHLLDYVAVTYSALDASARKVRRSGSYSVWDLLAAYKMGSEVVCNRVRAGGNAARLDELVPEPVI